MTPTVIRQQKQLVDHGRDERVLELVQTAAGAVHYRNHRDVVDLAFAQRSEDGAEILLVPLILDNPIDTARLDDSREKPRTRNSACVTSPPSTSSLIMNVVDVHIDNSFERMSRTSFICSLAVTSVSDTHSIFCAVFFPSKSKY